MPKLVPYQGDPFAGDQPAAKLVPFQGDPFANDAKPAADILAAAGEPVVASMGFHEPVGAAPADKETPLSDLITGTKRPPKPVGFLDTVGDMAKGAGAGLAKGAYELAASPVTLKQGGEWLIDQGLRGGLNAKRWAFGEPQVSSDEFAAMGAPALSVANKVDAPIYGAVNAGREALGGVLPQPQTNLGRYTETAASFIPAMAAPELLAGRIPTVGNVIRQAVVPGLTAQGATDLSKGTGGEKYAGIIGALLGQGAGALMRTPTAAAASLVGRASQGITPQQWQQADALVQQAQRMGVPLTSAEAIQQVTNGGTNLGALQRFAENSPQSADQMAAFMAPRAGQVRAAGENFFDTLAPQTDTPSVLGMNLQRAGREAIGDVQGQRSAATRPYYQASNPQHVPQQDMDAILADIQAHAAGDQTGLLQVPLNDFRQSIVARPGTPATTTAAAVPDLPITNIENLDRARKYWRDRIDAPQIAPNALQAEQGGAIGDYLHRINALLEQNPDFLQGKTVHGQMSRDLVNPVLAGPVGQVAATADVIPQAQALMPKNPLIGSEAEARDAAERLMLQDHEATRGVVRQGLQTDFNAAVRPRGATQDDQFGGARFANEINGNPQRSANVQAVLEAIAGPQSAQGMQDLTQVLGATGWRPRPNSATAFNAQIGDELKSGSIASIVKALSNAPRAAADWADRTQLGSRTNMLADLMVGPDALPRVQAIAQQFRPGRGREAVVRALLQAPDAYHAPSRQ